MLGRFGWKAGIPTIAQQTAEAASGDIGLSTTMIPHGAGDCTEKETACIEAPNGNSAKYQNVELGDELFKLVTFYAQNLAVPARRKPGDPQVLKGKEVFYDILAFFSPSGINSLLVNFPDFKQNNTRIAAFGPTTAKAVRDAGLILDIEAPLPNAPSMTGALELYIKKANGIK